MNRIYAILFCLPFLCNSNIAQVDIDARGLKPNQDGSRNFIFTIGIDKYDNWMHLENAVNDATSFSEVLKEDFGFEQIVSPLYNEEANRSNILNVIKTDLRDKLRLEDRLIIFFAGHGFTEKEEVDGELIERSYLVPSNAETEQERNKNNYIDIANFLELISELPAFHISVFLDACNSGFALKNSTKKYRSGSGEIDILETKKSRKVFTSAKSDQVAFDEGPIEGNSLYTGILIQGLKTKQADSNANGSINMLELALFLQQNMNEFYPNLQTPDYGAFLDDNRGEMILKYGKNVNDSFRAKGTDESSKLKYTALSFRSYSEVENQNLGAWIAETILDGLVEFKNPNSNFEVLNPNAVRVNDYSDIRSYANFIEDNPVDRLFTGSYLIENDELIIKTQLVNSKQKIIYAFPDLIGPLSEKRKLLAELKLRIKGFLVSEEDVLSKLSNPPDYDAFKSFRKALTYYSKDHDKMRFHLDKAISKDPDYFNAYLYRLMSFLEYFIDLEEAKKEREIIIAKNFELTEYQEFKMDITLYEALGDYETCLDLSKNLFELYRDKKSMLTTLFYMLASNNQTALREFVDDNLEANAFPELKNRLVLYRMNTYIMSGEKDDKFENYYSQLKDAYELKQSAGLQKWYARIMAKFDCQDGSCQAKIHELFRSNPPDNLWLIYLGIGKQFEMQGQEDLAEFFYNKSQENSLQVELSHNYHSEIACKNGNCEETINWFEKNAKNLSQTNEDLNQRIREVEVYISACKRSSHPIKNMKLIEELLLEDKSLIFYSYYVVAKAYAVKGDKDKAFIYLKKAYSNGMGKSYGRYLHDPDLESMLDHKAYLEFAKSR